MQFQLQSQYLSGTPLCEWDKKAKFCTLLTPSAGFFTCAVSSSVFCILHSIALVSFYDFYDTLLTQPIH